MKIVVLSLYISLNVVSGEQIEK